MSTDMPEEVRIAAMAANLQVLHALLTAAAQRSGEGWQLISNGERNGAIGSVLGLDAILDDAKSLYGAAIALHRAKVPLR